MSFPIRCAATCFAFLLSAVGFAGGPVHRGDFSGTWKLNAARSRFAPLPPVSDRIDEIVQTPDTLTIHRAELYRARHRNLRIVIYLDGSGGPGPITETRRIAHWEGNALIVESSTDFEGLSVKVRDRWTLVRRGRELEIARHFENHQGVINQKFVLERQ